MARPAASRCRQSLRSAALASLCMLVGYGSPANAEPVALERSVKPNIVLVEGPGMAEAAQDLYLEVILNQVHTRRVMHVAVDAQDRLYAWPQNLREIGLHVAAWPQNRYLGLDEIADIETYYDAARQQLHLDAAGSRLNLRPQSINTVTPQLWAATAHPGVLLNYDLYASHDTRSALAAATALRAFGIQGVLESTGLSRFVEGSDSRSYIRLDTSWTLHSQADLWTFTAGDFVSGALPWTRATRLGGIQLRRNFGLQPGLITYPIPQFFGEAAVPSAIELYVDGVRRYRGEVLPGPFALTTPPNINGAGQAQLVIIDALGRSQITQFDFYNADRLLRQGLSDYSVELGSVRREYGNDSFAYRSGAAASASLRHGLRDWLTLEAHAEGEDGLAAAGAGTLLRVGSLGTLRGAYAHSSGQGDGGLISLGYNWTAGGYTADYSLLTTHDDYRDLASLDGRAPPQRAERALLGASAGAAGQLSLSYTRLDTTEEGRFRSIGLNYSVTAVPRLSLFISVSRNLDDEEDIGAFAGLSLSLGNRLSIGANASRNGGSERYGSYASQPVPSDGGGGWVLRSQHGEGGDLYQGEVGYRADRAEWRAGANLRDGQDSIYAGVGGAVVLMQRDLFLARSVSDGFALVSTDGVAGVPVLLENREIGRTDARGHYLLTGLNAWQPNRIAVDPLHLPVQVQFDRERIQAVPADRAGIIARFGMRETRAALLILQDAHGHALPLGTRVLFGDSGTAVVGYDGQVYLENLQSRNRIDVLRDNAPACSLQFAYAASTQDIPVVGPMRCEE
jgi:outer membrane usher protein